MKDYRRWILTLDYQRETRHPSADECRRLATEPHLLSMLAEQLPTTVPEQLMWLLHVFGCLAWVNIPKAKQNNKNLDQQAVAAIFIGYSLEQKGWLFYSPDY